MEKIRKYIGKIGKGIATTALAGCLALGSLSQARVSDSFDRLDEIETKNQPRLEKRVFDLCMEKEDTQSDIEIFGDFYGTLDSLKKRLVVYDSKIDSVTKELVNIDGLRYDISKEIGLRASRLYSDKLLKVPKESICEYFLPVYFEE